jgi:hypothetical protein
MALGTYSDLQTAVASYLHRSDLTAVIPDFITLAEERMNRALRVRQMEVVLAETAITDGAIAVPADTAGVKTLYIVGYESSPLLPQSYDFIVSRGSDGVPAYFAWQVDSFLFDGSGTVTGVLYEKIPALSVSNTTNWLLTAYPSAYLHGALMEACVYLRDEAGIAFFDGKFQQALGEIAGSAMRDSYSGPLVARAR